MSAAAAPRRPVHRLDWRLIAAFWAVLALVPIAYTATQPDGLLLFGDNAMRMVTVEQLLDGQGWQDLGDDRDNTPFGTTMHWSRLIDAPIAALTVVAAPLAGAHAPQVAAMVWPALLLLPLLVLAATLTQRLVPDAGTLTALALTVASFMLVMEFLPGRVDHHNAQMVLSLAATAALLTARHRIAGGIAAGVVTATSLAIGMETLPIAAATIAIYALLWLAQPDRYREPLTAFGATLATATLLHFLAATAPANYFVAACDMLSIAYLVPLLAGGAGIAVVAILASRLPLLWHRGAVLALAGGLTFALVVILFPRCLAGPYAMPELLAIPHYFDLILEAQPLLAAFAANPLNAFVYAAATLVALPLTAWRAIATRGEQRVDWLIVLGFLLAGTATMVLQLRGVRLAALYALPAAAWLISAARARYERRPSMRHAGLLVGSWLLVCSAAHFGVVAAGMFLLPQSAYATAVLRDTEKVQVCLGRIADVLGALPPGRVMAPFNMGPNILLYSPHSIVSAGFHRNLQGTSDTVAFFSGDEAAARRIARERGIDYVVRCSGYPEYDGAIGPDAAHHWSWLQPLSPPADTLEVYRVDLTSGRNANGTPLSG